MKRGVLMGSVILQAETLNLPEVFAFKLRGKKVELIENGNSIIINPVRSSIDVMHGMFKSDGHAVDSFLERNELDKESEFSKRKSIDTLLQFASKNRVINKDFVFNRDDCYDE